MKNMFKHNQGGTTIIFVSVHGLSLEVLIDTEDFEKVNSFPNKWGAQWDAKSRTHYIRGHIKRKKIYLHRYITDTPRGMVVDHKNHKGEDNRRCNLRVCSQRENVKNKRPVDKPVYDSDGLHLFHLNFNPYKYDGKLYWGTSYVKGIYLGSYEDYAEAGLVQFIGNSVINNMTDEQLLNRICALGHKKAHVQKLINYVRHALKKPNPSKMEIQ